jgi:glycosyltransferase involved in cell wall biosynthesis
MTSVVLTCFNRKSLLTRTLNSLGDHLKRCQVVVVDDGSREGQRLEDLRPHFGFDLVRIEPAQKKKNCCAAFNAGFRHIKGDITIMQNAECLHVGDLIGSFLRRISDNVYLSAACYSLDVAMTNKVSQWDSAKIRQHLLSFNEVGTYDGHGWYNHPRIRPTGYHFASCITTENLYKLNGFDDRYSQELCFDDDEFLRRVKRMGLNVVITNPDSEPFVAHQHHHKRFPIGYDVSVNEHLFNSTASETAFRAEKGIV